MPSKLPKFNSEDRQFQMLQTQWASILDPVLAKQIINGRLITGQVLTTGTNTINHGLSRELLGWIIVGQGAAATFYDQQATNQLSDRTLILVSSANVTVSLWVF